jgi:hypothetical protein
LEILTILQGNTHEKFLKVVGTESVVHDEIVKELFDDDCQSSK